MGTTTSILVRPRTRFELRRHIAVEKYIYNYNLFYCHGGCTITTTWEASANLPLGLDGTKILSPCPRSLDQANRTVPQVFPIECCTSSAVTLIQSKITYPIVYGKPSGQASKHLISDWPTASGSPDSALLPNQATWSTYMSHSCFPTLARISGICTFF